MLTVIILAKNEESVIADCIKSVSFADEVLVVDDNSTDGTADVSRNNGATVLKHTLDDYASARNWAIKHASHTWILFLDADERVSPELAKKIISVVQSA